jgi:hypothetical protein
LWHHLFIISVTEHCGNFADSFTDFEAEFTAANSMCRIFYCKSMAIVLATNTVTGVAVILITNKITVVAADLASTFFGLKKITMI